MHLAMAYGLRLRLRSACALRLALGILESGSEPRKSGCEPSRTRIRTKLDSDPNQAN